MEWKAKRKALTAIRNNKLLTPFQKNVMDGLSNWKNGSTVHTQGLATLYDVKKFWMTKTLNVLKAFGYIEIVHFKSNTDNNNCYLYVHPIPIKFKNAA
jgi:hypothetical protein